MTDARRILVVGAGPTGLTAAVELARRGTVPVVVDGSEGPTPLSKAVGISPRSLDLLDPSGVTGRLLEQGIPIERLQMHRRGRVLATIRPGRLRHRFPFLLALPQSITEALMEEVLGDCGGRVQWRTRLVALELAGEGVNVVLEGPEGREEGSYQLVYGADGARSSVREALGVEFPGYEHQRAWSIADVEIEGWPYESRAAHLFLQDGGDLGLIIPIGQHRFRAVSNTRDAISCIPGGYRISRRLREDVFEIPVRQAARYAVGGVYLGGDAAHVHSPVGARGMNLGIEDAACFARRLHEDSLAGYQAERRPVGGRWISVSERLLAAVQARHPLAQAARDVALRVVGASWTLQRPMVERVAGLKE